MKRLVPLVILLSSALWAHPARADLMVAVGNASIAQGGQGTLDVLIRADSSAGVKLSAFEFTFELVNNNPMSATLVQFIDPQPTGYQYDSSYVFASSAGALVGTVSPPFLSYSDSNFTASSDGYEVVPDSDRLLARLSLTASTGLFSPLPGETFTLSLKSAKFYDENFNEIAYTSTAGTVQIESVAVPEPSSLSMVGISALVMALVIGRGRLRNIARR